MPHVVPRSIHALVHALYFLGGGLWALMGKRSFEDVTGPKVDYWLVRTVGALLTTIGLVIISASQRQRITPEIAWLAQGTSAALATSCVVYTAKGRIRKIYLIDAVVNILLIVGWHITEEPNSETQFRPERGQ